MKVGDLVRLKFRGNGHPAVGVIYACVPSQELMPSREPDSDVRQSDEVVYRCLWSDPFWNNSFYSERSLVVISESR